MYIYIIYIYIYIYIYININEFKLNLLYISNKLRIITYIYKLYLYIH